MKRGQFIATLGLTLALAGTALGEARLEGQGTILESAPDSGKPHTSITVSLDLSEGYTLTIPGGTAGQTESTVNLTSLQQSIGTLSVTNIKMLHGSLMKVSVKSQNGYQLVGDKGQAPLSYKLGYADQLTNNWKYLEETDAATEIISYDPQTTRRDYVNYVLTVDANDTIHPGTYTDQLTFEAGIQHPEVSDD